MTETIDDQALLSPAEVVSLQRTIEAGVLARAAYALRRSTRSAPLTRS